MTSKKKRHIRAFIYITGVGVFYWIIETVIDSIVQKEAFFTQLFPSNPHGIWTKSIMMASIVIFGGVVYYMFLSKQRDAQRLINECQAAEKLMRIQRDLGIKLGSISELNEALSTILEAAIGINGIDSGGVYLVNPDGSLNLAVHKGLSESFVKKNQFFDSQDPHTSIVMTGKPVYSVFSQVVPSSTEHDVNEKLKALAIIPVQYKNRIIASLNISSHSSFEVSSSTRNAIESMATRIGAVIVRLKAEEDLRDSESKYRTLFQSSNDGIYVADMNTKKIVYANPSFCKILGYSEKEILHLDAMDIHPRRDLGEVIYKLESLLENKNNVTSIVPCQRKDGSIVYADISETKMTLSDKECMVGFLRDMTERKQFEDTVRETEERVAASVSDAIIIVDTEWNISFWNESGEKMFGFVADEVIGRKLSSVILSEGTKNVFQGNLENFNIADQQAVVGKIFEGVAKNKNGNQFPIELRVSPVEVKGSWQAVVTIRDIQKRKDFEDQLKHGIFYDQLTNLPNRTLFLEKVRSILDKQEKDDISFAVFLVDIDRFQIIINSLGPSLGDQLLVYMARRLKRCLQTNDMIAHLGGDEFLVLLKNIKDINVAIRIAERIQKSMIDPFNIGGQAVFITVSLGITLGKANYEKAENMLRDADTAMHRAKSQGRARYAIFDTDMHLKAVEIFIKETALRHAIENKELTAFYQPIVDLKTGGIVGFESLIRWIHEKRGVVLPGEFMPIAEENGLIIGLDRWVLNHACKQVKKWQDKFTGRPPVYVSVNFSSKQFLEPDLPSEIDRVIKETGLDPNTLKLEITESALMEQADSVIDMLAQLKQRRIQLYLDDFGTGYSSLNYLRRLQIDSLKIDRSFISNMMVSVENLKIIETIIILAHQLNIDVIAEGIETAEQLAKLKELHCDYGQGFYFAKPKDSRDAERLLKTGTVW